MAKKAQKSNKKEQANTTPKTSKIQKNSKKKDQPKETGEVELFSENFYAKVDQFKDLYEEINANIAGSGKEDKFESVRTALEENCSQILKSHLAEAQKWLDERISSLKQSITNLEGHEKEARQVFEKSGVLSEEEIAQSLAALREKITEKEDSLNEFEGLLKKSKQVYE